MQFEQVNKKRCGVFLGIWMLLEMLLLCGCADRSAEEYFFEEAECISESSTMPTAEADAQTGQEEAESLAAMCVIHICGAVKNPGVYELPEGSRIMDAVEAGGGFLEEADQAACNLAQPVVDGCQIYIAAKDEKEESSAQGRSAGIQDAEGLSIYQKGTNAAGPEDGGKVNLNTADAAALKTLPGIGDSRAAAIIAFRETNGGFICIEDIMKVSGIKQAAFDKIKDKITV